MFQAVDVFLTGAINRARVAELIMAVQVSQACNSALKEDALNRLARTQASTTRDAAVLQLQLPLATLDSATLAHLLRRTLRDGPLAAQCEILQDLIAAYNSGELASGSAVLDLSPMFKGASWREASCLLRFIYHPRSDASPANLAVLAAAGLLPGVARLAHCLDCRPVLAAVDGFLTGTINRARVAELIVAAQVSQACNSALKEDTLNLLARKLASAAHAAALPPPQLPLAALDSAALAHLLRRTLREVARRRLKGGRRGLRLFGIKRAPQHGAQQAAGTPQQAQGGAAHAARRKVKVRRRPY
ncbi:hypothetical protein C2E21_7141 [Chlorella sorokiniana]|uniref:Uncharacterized protein n=1 Tax=Chlorella sorokiniana TaxID=3076 RepID=A0A2P6TIL4_CHLSO|nr:hypothetical protein C2E21_7141 [Chlorella sorokiniana]|eukprot:PRW39059.1 hypothetical protein C2E21_7141 [Chlorella sorokiniana]